MPSLPLLLAQTDPAAPPAAPAQPAPPNVVPEGPIEGQQAGTVDPATGTTTAPPGAGPSSSFMWIILLAFVLLWVFMLGGQRKEKKKREQLLSSIKKGDKVQTVGGELGTVMEIRDNEVVLKVDENNNTRIRYARSAIQTVVHEKTE